MAVVSVVFGVIELLVGLRFFFRLLGADPSVIFISWVYTLSEPLVAPFTGIFSQTATAPGTVVQSVFEPSTLVALIVYAIVGSLLLQFLNRL